MAAPAFHESLPYIDTPSESELARARALVAQEAQATPRGDTTQQAAPEPAFSETMQTELARVASSTALTPLDTSRYEAQDLPPPGEGTGTAPVLGRAYTSAAYLRGRLQNLELLERHGAPAWLLANYHLEAALGRAEAELARAKGEVDGVNDARRRRQADVAAEMAGLEETWRTGVGRVLETELAVEELRASIREELRKKGGLSG
ncbi:Pre-mRNA-splicing factor SPF27 [Metarhizium anisopliae]|nr:Pre-mRNA-splicing factor SPF27 [Metarhizium anisopliae]